MRSKRQCRPGVESLADRIVLSHLNPVVSLAHIDAAHVHFATLTFKGTYLIPPADVGFNNERYVSFETPVPANIMGLGLVELGGNVSANGPGLALQVHPLAWKNGMAINNYSFSQGVYAPNPGLFHMQFGKKIAPFTRGFTFAYTFVITWTRGEFAGAHGSGKVEVKLVPKPPLVANAPANTQYTGNCTVRFHFSPATVLT
jgi:hypothetical protein